MRKYVGSILIMTIGVGLTLVLAGLEKCSLLFPAIVANLCSFIIGPLTFVTGLVFLVLSVYRDIMRDADIANNVLQVASRSAPKLKA